MVGNDKIWTKALSYAYRLLSYRPRSQKELSARLARKDFPPEVVQEIIEFLKEKGYLDDLSFARFWVNSRLSANPIGKQLLKLELRKKGVNDSVIEQVLAQTSDLDNELILAREVAERRLKVLKKNSKLGPEKIKRRLCDYLLRRGFSYETIMEILDEKK